VSLLLAGIENHWQSSLERLKLGHLDWDGAGRGLGQELGEKGGYLTLGYRVSVLQDEKSSRHWLHNNLEVFNTTELNIQHGENGNFMYILPHLKLM
jgi:hypothetical protein